jgi:hypothetical protein
MSSPLEEYNQKNTARWEILSDIPIWEHPSLFSWLYKVFIRQTQDMYGARHDVYNSEIIRGIEVQNRLVLSKDLGIVADSWPDPRKSLSTLLRTDSRRAILFLELLVKYLRDSSDSYMFYGSNSISKSSIVGYLQTILDNGSMWTIVNEQGSNAGFIERVDPQITSIAKDIKNKDLDRAWALAFQPTPDPEKAIEHAQSAIESVASKHSLTTATSKVYGNLLGDIKARKSQTYISVAKPAFDLSNVLAGDKSNEIDINDQFADWFATGMNIVQKTNPARHKSKTTTDFQVSPEAARQAVLIASLLCHFIEQGYIAKLEKKTTKQPPAAKKSTP